jgi:hypothetical protein
MKRAAALILIVLALGLAGCTQTNTDDQKPVYFVPPVASAA